ncbi:HDOD domain-containing protein [Aeromonas jandaei]|uniref:EAL and HDOD domain-containing protein n=1 Tax=Aeromonas jandaei TaxID=650 RepID=UPI00191F86FB|nr:HDOD domain-containing protein [Aeromonas jandaei]MBL0599088.1 HDOD domain-containing protein [Aeromonas jandaei]
MYTYVARQPILDKNLKTYAYELLFRDGYKNSFPSISAQEATSKIIVEQFFHNNIQDLVGELPYFINFPYSLLVDGCAECLPIDKAVIEILEDTKPDDTLLKKVKELYHMGYSIALDDFTLAQEWERFLPFIRLIKFDLRTTSLLKIKVFMQKHSNLDITYVAEKVESHSEFEQLRSLGIHLFQGFFFSRPEMVKQTTIAPSKIVIMRLLNAVNQDSPDFNMIESIIGQDVALSVKLLRYVNSIKGHSNSISSFRQAAIYLGSVDLKRFVSLIAITAAGGGKNDELHVMSLVRARFCEQLACARGSKYTEESFISGLFSLLDVLMEQPMNKILELLPLTDSICSSLLNRDGELGFYLELCEDYEKARWISLSDKVRRIGLHERTICKIYQEATKWVDMQMLAIEHP